MQEEDATRKVINEISAMPEPWRRFCLDSAFTADIRTQEDYDRQDKLRKLIYTRFEEEKSISMGHLPPIISPIFWEVWSGTPNSEVMSIKYCGQPIDAERYERQKTMANYLPRIEKFYILNLSKYCSALRKTYSANGWSKNECYADIERRFEALRNFRGSIERGEWPKLLMVVDNDDGAKESFTITPHFHVRVERGHGPDAHRGTFAYCPEKTDEMEEIWAHRWEQFLGIARRQPEWDEERDGNDGFSSSPERMKTLNKGALDRIQESLHAMRRRIRYGKVAALFDFLAGREDKAS